MKLTPFNNRRVELELRSENFKESTSFMLVGYRESIQLRASVRESVDEMVEELIRKEEKIKLKERKNDEMAHGNLTLKALKKARRMFNEASERSYKTILQSSKKTISTKKKK